MPALIQHAMWLEPRALPDALCALHDQQRDRLSSHKRTQLNGARDAPNTAIQTILNDGVIVKRNSRLNRIEPENIFVVRDAESL